MQTVLLLTANYAVSWLSILVHVKQGEFDVIYIKPTVRTMASTITRPPTYRCTQSADKSESNKKSEPYV